MCLKIANRILNEVHLSGLTLGVILSEVSVRIMVVIWTYDPKFKIGLDDQIQVGFELC